MNGVRLLFNTIDLNAETLQPVIKYREERNFDIVDGIEIIPLYILILFLQYFFDKK